MEKEKFSIQKCFICGHIYLSYGQECDKCHSDRTAKPNYEIITVKNAQPKTP